MDPLGCPAHHPQPGKSHCCPRAPGEGRSSEAFTQESRSKKKKKKESRSHPYLHIHLPNPSSPANYLQLTGSVPQISASHPPGTPNQQVPQAPTPITCWVNMRSSASGLRSRKSPPQRAASLHTVHSLRGPPHRSPGTPGAEGWRMKGTGRGQGGSPIPPPICPGHWRPGHTPPPLSLPSAGIPSPGCSGQGRVTRSRGWLPAQAMIWDFRKSCCPSSPRQ